MCGIWGFSGGKPDKSILQHVIMKSNERGGHSHGYAFIRNGKPVIVKSLERTNIAKIREDVSDVEVAIGHHRLATEGEVTLYNTQPFVSEDHVFVHNGNIRDHLAKALAYDYKLRTEVDSELAGRYLDKGAELSEPHALLSINLLTESLKSSNFKLPLYSKTINSVTYYCSKPIQI